MRPSEPTSQCSEPLESEEIAVVEGQTIRPRQAPFAHHRGQVGEETPDSKTAPEGAAIKVGSLAP